MIATANYHRLMSLPCLHELAEKEAREIHRAILGCEPDSKRLEAWTYARLTQLCNLSIPASRDAMYRLLAERISDGWEAWNIARAIEMRGSALVSLRFKINIEACESWYLNSESQTQTILAAILLHVLDNSHQWCLKEKHLS